MIIGICKDEGYETPYLYVWLEIDGQYEYVGDIEFNFDKDKDTLYWRIHTLVPSNQQVRQEFTQKLNEEIEHLKHNSYNAFDFILPSRVRDKFPS